MPLTAASSMQRIRALKRFSDTVMNIDNKVDNLDNRMDRVGASAAALAALHPLDFDPDAKWDFAAGYGNYKGANAAAIGAFYRPNEDTMFSVGGSFSGGENMVNAGLSLKIGQGNHVSTSRVAMAKKIVDQDKRIQALTRSGSTIDSASECLHGYRCWSGRDDRFPGCTEEPLGL
jgi:hypothetical protein